jgi:hypothetical protein
VLRRSAAPTGRDVGTSAILGGIDPALVYLPGVYLLSINLGAVLISPTQSSPAACHDRRSGRGVGLHGVALVRLGLGLMGVALGSSRLPLLR